jgi:acyl homoserine lactone synthase
VIHLITSRNAALYENEINSLHATRKSVFVDELGWKLPVRDGMEFDEYDDELAGNVVGFSVDGEVVVGIRFRPTDDRSMLLDHFAHVLPRGIRPIDDGRTWELTRGFCIERGVRRHNLRRKAACMLAPLELAYAAGMDRCVGFTDVRMLSFCYGVGWKLNLLGAAAHYGEGDAVAYEVEVSHDAILKMRQMWGLPDPSYVEINELGPDENSVHQAASHLVRKNPAWRDLQAQVEPEAAFEYSYGSLLVASHQGRANSRAPGASSDFGEPQAKGANDKGDRGLSSAGAI